MLESVMRSLARIKRMHGNVEIVSIEASKLYGFVSVKFRLEKTLARLE